MKLIDLTGQKFGRLTVIKRVENNNNNKVCFLCKCDCGNTIVVTGSRLKTGNTKSCGCLHKEILIANNKKTKRKYNLPYDKLHKDIYFCWKAMKNRCSYKELYKNKNIKVCKEWENFENFYYWSINNGYSKELSIDRINNNGDYEPNNCRWVDVKIQNRNRTNSHLLTYNNKTFCLSEWEEITKLPIRGRFYKGWDIEKIFNTPKKCYNKLKRRNNASTCN